MRTLGPGSRVGIWVTGCEKRCKGCMSPELWEMRQGSQVSVDGIMQMIGKIGRPIDGFTISGGEPFLQPVELDGLVRRLEAGYTNDIIVYTGYRLKELEAKKSPRIASVLSCISVLIDGEYIDSNNDGKGIRGSDNQRIHILKPSTKYETLATGPRSMQTFMYNGQILIIGIR